MNLGDPTVQAALIVGLTAVIAGLVGGWIGGRAATNAMRLNIDDAAKAREEARKEARNQRFSDERRDAVVAYLKASDRILDGVMAIQRLLEQGLDPRDAELADLVGEMSSPMAALQLYAPDLAYGMANYYLVSLQSFRDMVVQWRTARLESKPGNETEPAMLGNVTRNCLATRADFLVAGRQHLGIDKYATVASRLCWKSADGSGSSAGTG